MISYQINNIYTK